MKRLLIALFTTFSLTITNAQTIQNLKCENEEKPLGLEIKKPHFSWEINSITRGSKQTAYQILVTDNEADLKKDNGNVWNSGIVKTNQNIGIEYGGKALESRKRYYWKVKIWNEKNKATAYSETTYWEMAIIDKNDWSAHWIGKNGTEGKPQSSSFFGSLTNASNTGNLSKSIELQKEFNLLKRATRARIYVTGLGAYSLIFNGKKVGQSVLTPGWTNYLSTIPYQIYEISNDDLSIGINFITATLGNAWWGSIVDYGSGENNYGYGANRLLFQMEMEFYDGSRQTVISDGSWKTRLSPVVTNSIYSGEVYDSQLEYGKDWENAAIMDDIENKTSKDEIFSTKNVKLVFQNTPQLETFKEIKPVKITEPRRGKYVFDFGENIIGFTKIQVEGKAGKEIEMKYAEKVTDKGLAEQSGNVRPNNKFILKGFKLEKWEPKFSFYGFRYVEVEGLTQKPDENTLVAKAIYINKPFIENLASSKDFIEKVYSKKIKERLVFETQQLIIEPKPNENIKSEEKNYAYNGNEIKTNWELKGTKFTFKINIPANNLVQIQLPLIPGKTINNIKESGKPLVYKKKPAKIDGVTYVKSEKDKVIFEVGSGKYDFVIE